MAGGITKNHRVIVTIRKEIHASEVAVGADDAVGVKEAFDAGIVIAGVEVIPAGLGVVVITAVADGVDVRHVIGVGDGIAVLVGHRKHLTPRVVGIPRHHVSIGIQNRDDIPLQVFPERVPGIVIADRSHRPVRVVVIEQVVGPVRFMYKLPVRVTVRSSCLYRFPFSRSAGPLYLYYISKYIINTQYFQLLYLYY